MAAYVKSRGISGINSRKPVGTPAICGGDDRSIRILFGISHGSNSHIISRSHVPLAELLAEKLERHLGIEPMVPQ